MRAATIRRMIVFGVCAVGVGCLYLVPSIAGSRDQVSLPPLSDEPTNAAPSGSTVDGTPQPAATGVNRDVTAPNGDGGASNTGGEPQGEPSSDQRQTVRGATAYDPNDTRDRVRPTAVDAIKSAHVSPRRLALTWDAASDNVGVVGYRIWVNGFAVATTAETHAKVRWFNDDSGQHVVQVRAIDAEGNESATSPTLVVTRPSTGPTPTPTPDPTTTPEPTPAPTTTAPEPTADPTNNATTPPTPEPSGSPTE